MWLSAVRLSETGVAFARSCACGVETAIAFAGKKWAFLLRFSAALVLSVSMVAVQGCAVVMVVSCWSTSVAAEVSLVAKLPWAGPCARKSSPCALTTPQIRRFCACWASFFAEIPLWGWCWANFFVPTGSVPRSCRRCSALGAGCDGGFAPCEAL